MPNHGTCPRDRGGRRAEARHGKAVCRRRRTNCASSKTALRRAISCRATANARSSISYCRAMLSGYPRASDERGSLCTMGRRSRCRLWLNFADLGLICSRQPVVPLPMHSSGHGLMLRANGSVDGCIGDKATAWPRACRATPLPLQQPPEIVPARSALRRAENASWRCARRITLSRPQHGTKHGDACLSYGGL